MAEFLVPLQYYPLQMAAKLLTCDETELLLLAHAGDITFFQYPDPTLGLVEWDEISPLEVSAIILEGTKTGRVYREYLNGFNICRSDLVLPREEILKAHQILYPTHYASQSPKPIPERITSKQCRFIVALLRAHGMTDEDFQGSITKLQKKMALKAIEPIYGDDKTLTDWLVRAGVR